jgi:lipoprotein signal peptidase
LLKIKPSNLIAVLAAILVALELWLKDYLLNNHPDVVVINSGAAFGLGNASTALWGIVLLVILAILQRLRPLHIWLTLLFVVILGVIERWRYGGTIDYLQISGLRFNLNDLVIIGLIITLLIYWQQKNGTQRP